MEVNKFFFFFSCMTYNHSAFIEETLNGFCSQQTTFPFVCAIIDDASTDGEPEVIRNYLSAFYKWAVLEEIVEKNPCAPIKPIKYTEEIRESLWLILKSMRILQTALIRKRRLQLFVMP